MAGLPAHQNGRSPAKPLSQAQQVVLEALADGVTAPQIARRLAKGDPGKARAIRRKLRRWATQPEFQAGIFQITTGSMVLALPEATDALGRRAARGQVDAIKLLYAATGFHSDKVDHNHSGEIQISVTIPRPATTVDELGPGKDYVDAEVVDED